MYYVFFVMLLFVYQSLCGFTLQFHWNKDENVFLSASFLHDMQRTFARTIFVETGTYSGDTAQTAAAYFQEVHSVEISEALYTAAREKLCCIPHIYVYHNNSADFLRTLCNSAQSHYDNMIFWLDAHDSGGTTIHYKDRLTPIVDELQVFITQRIQNAVILIDDIRCFGSQYDKRDLLAHEGYPTIQKIIELLKTINPHYACILSGDILIAYDKTIYDLEVSPVARACTISRLYDGADDFSGTIIEQESCIAHATDDESACIRTLCYLALHQADDYHALLWYGLLVLKTDPKIACAAFEAVLQLGYTHWRIYWYLAQAAHANHNNEQALLWIQQVLNCNPGYGPAQDALTDSINILGYAPK